MPQLTIAVDGDGAWPDLARREVVLGQWTHLSALPGGELRIGIRVELPDGRVLYTETSWALLYVAAKAIEARYGAPR